MTDNVIHIKKAEQKYEQKSERFGVITGELSSTGELNQKDRIGSAYMKRGTKKFRLKLWLMGEASYFVMPDNKDPRKYTIVIPDQYRFTNGESKTNWHRVGIGEVAGTYIRLKIHLLSEDVFLSMFPDKFHLQQAEGRKNDAQDVA